MLKENDKIESGIVDFLKKMGCYVDVEFISADRTQIQVDKDDSSSVNVISSIERRQEYIVDLYSKQYAEYSKLLSVQKDELPKYYIEDDIEPLKVGEFLKECKEYTLNISKMRDIGILEVTDKSFLEEISSEDLEKRYNTENARFFTIYLDAFKTTLSVFEDFYDRLSLFMSIINKRNAITKKALVFDAQKGFTMYRRGKNGQEEIPLENLSSGEKNDFVMFFDLIFEAQINSMVLIDEPEISLHIEWQEEYLDHLIKICKMNDLGAIVATHSPNIINGHFELFPVRGLENG